MNFDLIISQLYNSNEIALLKKSMPKTIAEDIIQNSFLKLININKTLFYELHNRGKLKNYLYSIVLNELRDFKRKDKQSVGIENIEAKIENIEYVEKSINFDLLNENEVILLQGILKSGSIFKLSQKTKINHSTLNSLFKKIKQKISQNGERYTTERSR